MLKYYGEDCSYFCQSFSQLHLWLCSGQQDETTSVIQLIDLPNLITGNSGTKIKLNTNRNDP